MQRTVALGVWADFLFFFFFFFKLLPFPVNPTDALICVCVDSPLPVLISVVSGEPTALLCYLYVLPALHGGAGTPGRRIQPCLCPERCRQGFGKLAGT